MSEYLLYTDGASRGNPGPAAIGAALYRTTGDTLEEVESLSEPIGITTNNVAEYRAVVAGLEMARRYAPKRLVLRADSQLLIRQMQGRYRVKSPNLRPLHRRATALATGFPAIDFEHVPREENTVADRLANRALDR